MMTGNLITIALLLEEQQKAEPLYAPAPGTSYEVGEDVTVTLLGPDAAIRTFIADMKGSYKGKPFAPRVFVTETLVRRDGKWLERQYQTTPLKP